MPREYSGPGEVLSREYSAWELFEPCAAPLCLKRRRKEGYGFCVCLMMPKMAALSATLPFLFLLLLVHGGSGYGNANRDADAGEDIGRDKAQDTALVRIAFGSCAHQYDPQPIWEAVNDFNPQLFIWLGDNIYADKKRPFRVIGKERTIGPWKNSQRFFPSSIREMEEKYAEAKGKPGYVKLRKRARIIGTWDDHDYGLNDSGKEFAEKNASQKLLLDFLDEPIDSIRRTQEGVYTSYVFGPHGKQIKVILLDTRYHRDPLFSNGNMLGEGQWTWLEKQLRENEAQITIIVSSIQVLPNFSALVQPIFYVEAWSHFPKERNRLFKIIKDTNTSGVLFISGDVHFAEVSRFDCGVSYPLYEITSSGLTHGVEDAVPSLSFLPRFAARLTPTTMRVFGSNCRYKTCVYGQSNFGTLVVDWDADPVSITADVRDVNGRQVLGEKIELSQLQPTDHVGTEIHHGTRHCKSEMDLPWFSRHFLAIVLISSLLGFASVLITCAYCAVAWSWKRTRKPIKAKPE